MLYEVQTTELKSMSIGPERSPKAGRSYYWFADYLRLWNGIALPGIAQISTVLLVVGLVISTVAGEAHVHAPAAHQAITDGIGHGDVPSNLVQPCPAKSSSYSPLTCSACTHARVSVPLLRHQQQSSESFRSGSMSAPRLRMRARSLRRISSGTRCSLKTTTQFSSLPRPPAICNRDVPASTTAFSISA